MAWIYLPAAVCSVSRLETEYPISEPSPTSRTKRTARHYLSLASRTDCLTTRLSGMMSKPLTADRLREWLTSLPAGSPVSLTLSRGNRPGKMTSETSGPTPSESLARYDPDLCYWRTSQGCLALDISDEFSETWPRAGTMRNGMLWARPTWEQATDENGCGYWPTAKSIDAQLVDYPDRSFQRDHSVGSLTEYIKRQMWATPRQGKTTDEDPESWQARNDKGDVSTPPLTMQAKLWSTPRTTDCNAPASTRIVNAQNNSGEYQLRELVQTCRSSHPCPAT